MNAFILDLAASFVVGGAWVMLASVAAQHFGGKVGGFIAGLPAVAALAIFLASSLLCVGNLLGILFGRIRDSECRA